MQSRSWGLIAGVALVIGAVLVGIATIWRWGPQASDAPVPLTMEVEEVTPSPSPPPVPTPVLPVTYTVQAGDTLSGIAQAHDVLLDELIAANNIANPNLLQIGQTLVIPQDDIPDPATPVAEQDLAGSPSAPEADEVEAPTLTPSGPPRVEISEVAGVGDLAVERVAVENRGGIVSLEGWTLSTATGETFDFPALTIFPGATVRVHSMDGENTPRDLFWGRAESAWQPGALLTLRNAEGIVVDTHVVPSP